MAKGWKRGIMNEDRWENGNAPATMLRTGVGRRNAAKLSRELRLFAVAVCRTAWDMLDDEGPVEEVALLRESVLAAEDFAELGYGPRSHELYHRMVTAHHAA